MDSITVEVPTHAVALLKFASGVIGTLTASFDVWSEHLPHIEIYGSRGILRLADPDQFDGNVLVKANDSEDWTVVPPAISLSGWSVPGERARGLGVADLVDSLGGATQRTSAELAYHVLEILESIRTASDRDMAVRMQSAPARPEPVSAGDLGGLVMAPADLTLESEVVAGLDSAQFDGWTILELDAAENPVPDMTARPRPVPFHANRSAFGVSTAKA